jgi:UDP-N-acetylmuramyl pentapeptide phosphotransferase/UDP-N-acetylglucosamine-1-phosphate transferase
MLILFGMIVFVLTAALFPAVIAVLKNSEFFKERAAIDIENAQSSHEVPIPRGGGLAVMPVIFVVWTAILSSGAFEWPTHQTFISVLICGIFLCAITWLDDYKPGGLRVRTRLFVQLVAVVIPLIFWPTDAGRILPDFVPVLAERVLMAMAWLWFVNLFNFMDGINGISGTEAISITGGLLLFTLTTSVSMPQGYEYLLISVMAAAAGFLVWNGRKVAKVFLGDVGSIGFGYCLAWLLFVFAAQGSTIPAALVAMAYCMDATVTLVKRAWQKKKIWLAHREHFFQRATVKGALTHGQCVAIIVTVNLLLIFIGWALLQGMIKPWQGLFLGLVITSGLLRFFFVVGKRHGHKSSPRPKAFYIERYFRFLIRRIK